MSELREILAARNPELWLVTAIAPATENSSAQEKGSAIAEGRAANGMIATSVTSVSIVPEMPRVLLAVSKRHWTWELIERHRHFALHLLRQSNIDLVWRFGMQSGRTNPKFSGVATQIVQSDTRTSAAHAEFLVVPECLSWLGCRVEEDMDIGDRKLLVSEVIDGGKFFEDPDPLSMRHLAAVGDADKLAVLRDLAARDAALDAPQIELWRNEKRSVPGNTSR